MAFDDEAIITFASPALTTLTGFHPEMVVGHSLAEFLHPDDIERVAQLMYRWGGRRGSTVVPSVRVRVAAGDWLAVMVDAVSGPEVAPLGTFLVTLRKVGDSSEVEQQLRTRLANEARLVRLASSFVNPPADVHDDGVERALAEMSGLGGVDRVEVVLYDADRDVWINSHEWAAPNIERIRHKTPPVAHADTPFLRALHRNEEVAVASVPELDEEWAAERAWFTARGVGSCLAVPLSDQGQVVGFMGFEAVNREFVFAAGHLITLRSAAGILSQAFARQAAERRLAHQARHDPLTGLPNRWAFLEELTRVLDRASAGVDRRGIDQRGGRPVGVAVLLLDLDRFKVVNDSLGHGLGDVLLIALARRLDDACPPASVLARMGGDEFVRAGRGLRAPSRGRRRRPRPPAGAPPAGHGAGPGGATTASVGIAYDRATPTRRADDLLRHADAAMYAAKELGRDRIEVFDDDAADARCAAGCRTRSSCARRVEHGELDRPLPARDRGAVGSGASGPRPWCGGSTPTRGLLTRGRVHRPGRGDRAHPRHRRVGAARRPVASRSAWHGRHPRSSPCSCGSTSRPASSASPTWSRPVVERSSSETGIDPANLCLEITETHGHGRRRGLGRGAREAARPRRRAGHRRLRHGLLVAQLPASGSPSTC